MLRLLIGTGVLLMAVGFGAAGWQYWKTLPPAAAVEDAGTAETGTADTGTMDAAVAAAPKQQGWLISPTGGLVPQSDVLAYLAQEQFTPDRTLTVIRQARLTDLLAGEEKLPEAPFLQVLADIRASKLGGDLCRVLEETIATDCAMNTARVVDGSVDELGGTASFRLELVYRLKDDQADLPDLATRVLNGDVVRIDLESGAAGTDSPATALRAALDAVDAACAAENVGEICRPLRLQIEWAEGKPVTALADIAWLDPLPNGMFVAPPLDTASGG